MNYTDKELLRSTQIAYYDINSDAIREVPEEDRSTCTLNTLFRYSVIFKNSIYDSLSATCGFTVTADDREEDVLNNKALEGNEAKKVAISAVYDIIGELQDDKAGSIGSWKLVSYVFNDDIGVPGVAGKLKADGSWETDLAFSTSGDGLCAYVFETADDSAIVAFRGSQPLNDLAEDIKTDDFKTDWIAADFGLALNSEDTPQQQSTKTYIQKYIVGLGYDNLAFAGHSLGGNLAMHAAVSMYEIDADKATAISQVSSFDGPGYSESYMDRHPVIETMTANNATCIEHFSWSVVGMLLDQYASNDYVVKAGYYDENGDFEDMKINIAVHNPAYVQLTDSGELVNGETDLFMDVADLLVDWVMEYPESFRPYLIHLVFAIIENTDIKVEEEVNAHEILDLCNTITCLASPVTTQHNIVTTYFSFTNLLELLSSEGMEAIFNNTYDLSEIAEKTNNVISDCSGVNQLVFPCTKDQVKIYHIEDSDAVKVVWGSDDNYVIINKYADQDRDAQYNLIFSDGEVMGEAHTDSPFRTLYGTDNGDVLKPLFDDENPIVLYGGNGSDTLLGGIKNDNLYGGDGIDTIYGEDGDDNIYGEVNSDKLFGGLGNDTIYGGIGDDFIHCDMVNDGGNGGNDVAHGDDGEDTIYGESGDDELHGGNDGDYLYGQDGDDELYGESGNDELNGGSGKDILHGGDGDDTLYGGEGNDDLRGNLGNDNLIGGGGTNTYRFFSLDSGHDIINGSTGDTIIELPYMLSESDVIAALGDDHTLILNYGNSSIKITNYFSEYANKIHKFAYRFGDGTEYLLDENSFAGDLHDSTFRRPISEIFGARDIVGTPNPFNRNYNDITDGIMDVISGEGDSEELVIDDGITETLYDDHDYLEALDEFMNDPTNQAYLDDAFDPEELPVIRDNIKHQLDYIAVVRDELPGLISAYYAYIDNSDSSDVADMADSANSMKDAYDQYVAAQNVPPLDPLIIDIAGDGFSFTSADEGVNFDMNNDGFAEKTGWTNGNDALLVLDRDGDGSITNGGELFGDQTTLADGTLASSGFVALAEFDENADGRIDSSDTVFSELNVWQDADHNGISAADELSSLTDMGIEAISLLPTAVDNTDAETGAYFASIANVVMSDGSDCNIGEFKFPSNLYDTNDLVVAEISEEIAALPNVRSFGSVLSLHKAMALDEDGSIREKISAFCEETDVAQADALLEEVLFELCDATDIAPDSRGRYIDARKLAVVERMLGSDFAGVNGSDPNSAAAPMLIDAYNTIFSTYYSTLAAQSTIDIYLKMGQLSVEDGSVSVNVGAVASYLGRQYDDGTDVSREAVDIGRYFRYLDTSYDTAYFVDYYLSCENISGDLQTLVAEGLIAAQMGTDNGEYIVGNSFDNVVFGNGGNDSLSMQGGVDIMFGGSDDDTIDGHGGNDHIIGGIGNDSLRGGDGADTYHFAQGFGNDVIYDSESYSTIRFYDGITLEDIYAVSPNRYDIVIGVNGTDDTITLPRFMWYETHRDFYLEFADGEKIHCLDENSPLNAVFGDDGDNNIEGNGSYSIIYGLGGKDWLEGTAGNDFLYGGDGNDTIEGGDGSDVLDGGADTDILRGNAGNDTYVFAKGYGVDSVSDNVGISTIKFIDEISPDELKVSYHDTTSIKISVDGTEDALILMGYRSSEDCRNIVMEFDDGTVLSGEDNYIIRTIHGTDANNVINAVDSNSTVYGYAGNDSLSGKAGDDVLYGGDGDDRLDGYDGNDILDGGAGTDRLYGENDDDIYMFGIGYGIDTIYDDIGTSTIRFMDGIEPDDLIFTPDSGYSYKLTVSGTEDALILNSYRSSASYQNYVMEFADGTVLSGEDNYIVRNIHGTESNDSITAIHNTSTIFGCAGDDTLRGSEADDVLYGGDGVDTLYGNGGNDTLDGGAENDSLQGGVGDDEYVFCIGHGVDKIVDKDGTNIIRFADDILPEDLKASYTGTYDIQLSIQGTDDALILNNYRHSELYQNYMMEFADGTLLTADNNHIVREIHGTDANNSISAVLDNVTLYGYAGDDTLRGTSTNDVIYGGDGVDTLYGNGGNDTLDGGTANDNLQGGAGDDTYIFGIGYGVDTISDSDGTSTIRFVGDITADDITLTCTNNNLSVSINGTEDSLTLLYFGKSESYRAFALEFENGSSYSIDPSTYTLEQNEVIDYAAAAEVVTEMQSFDAAPPSSDSSSCLIYPNVALINDILSVADSDVYGNVSENRLQYTDSTNMLFEQYYVR